MVTLNWTIILIAAIVPTITGMIWYNKSVFGTAWMNLSGLSEEKLKGGSMPMMIITSLFLSFLIAMSLNPIVIHQMGIMSTLMNEPGATDPTSEVGMYMANFMDRYGNNFRTFKHGALHGTLMGIFLILPILAINATFERKPFKLTMIHAGYWIVTLAIMGGLICQFK